MEINGRVRNPEFSGSVKEYRKGIEVLNNLNDTRWMGGECCDADVKYTFLDTCPFNMTLRPYQCDARYSICRFMTLYR